MRWAKRGVLFVTGYAATTVVGHCHLEPGMQVITKPFAMSALAGKVRDIIQTSGGLEA